MSTGRHAAKRAAQASEELTNKQNVLLAKEEKNKEMQAREIESQRISTTRARFGGQAPSMSAPNEPSETGRTNPFANKGGKNSTPKSLTNRDPMKNTLINMYMDGTNPDSDFTAG